MSGIGTGFARAFGGALLFAMPLLMTMELWRIAVAVDRWNLLALVVAGVLLTLGLAHTFGSVHGRSTWPDAVVDAGVAILAGTLAAALVLTVLEIVNPLGSWIDALSVIAIQAVPASLGAAYARGQLGQSQPDAGESTYRHELFLMAAGAVVFASNVAPTEEIILLASVMDESNAVLLLLLSLVLTHALVYGSGFTGSEKDSFARGFVAYTLPGYALALVLSAFVLWTFGRYEDTSLLFSLVAAVVLALPASLGAAAARLIL